MGRRTVLLTAMTLMSVIASGQQVHQIDEPGIQKPVLKNRVRANFTREAWDRRIEGTVVLGALIDAEGSVQEVVVTKSLDDRYGLDNEALKAVRQWTFAPATKDGSAIAVRATIDIKFTLARPEP